VTGKSKSAEGIPIFDRVRLGPLYKTYAAERVEVLFIRQRGVGVPRPYVYYIELYYYFLVDYYY
jgi:hypothetical protein